MTDIGDALGALNGSVGAHRIRTDEETRQRYGVDRTSGWTAAPCAVAFPESPEHVQAIVRIARSHRLGLVPSGGRTGLSGGAVAVRGELVVAMERMDRLLEFDPVDRMITVEAGMLTARLQQLALERGLCYPVDFASAGSSQIGGNIATNAGGIKVIRYGMTRQQVTGLTVVDGCGELMHFNNGLLKNNTGPDLRHLFIGSEGCLGIVTSATLQLQSPPRDLRVALLAVPSFGAIPELLQHLRAGLSLTAFEFLAHAALGRVLERGALHSPLARAAPFYVLVEYEPDPGDGGERALELVSGCMEEGLVLDAVQAGSVAQSRALWRLREDISETLARWTPWKNDLSVRIGRMEAFIERVEQLAARAYAGLELVWYGHIGDGNVHLNILRPEAMGIAEFIERCTPAGREIAALVNEFGGSISAEHGVGLLKKEYLAGMLGETGVQRLRELKRVFDPDGILNPGKLVDL